MTTSRPPRHHLLSKAVLLVVMVAGLLLSHPQIARAATVWNVTPTSACTFSDAITASNTSAASGSCAAGSGGTGTIDLAAGTYTLGVDLPAASSALTVVGAGVGSTVINGQNQYAVFSADGGVQMNVSNLTIEESGDGDPAILSEGGTINNVVVENSNSAGYGIVMGGGGTITNTAVTNVTENNANNLDGVGLALTAGTFTVKNVTLYGNGVGVLAGSSSAATTVNATNVTIAGNSNTADVPGGITAINTTFNLENSILDNNLSGGTSANCGTGTFPLTGDQMVLPTSQGHNIISDNTCGFVGTSNQSDTNPELGSLTLSNGTYVLPITYSSPAYANAYTADAPATDQRGVNRPQCGTADVGAYETTTCAPSGGSSGGSSGSSSSEAKKSGASSTNNADSTTATPTSSTGSGSMTKTDPTSGKSDGSQKSVAISKKTVASKQSGSPMDILIGIIIVLLVAASGGLYYFSKNSKLRSKLLGKFKVKPARKAH